jgi:MSHA biogenesis protein MshK
MKYYAVIMIALVCMDCARAQLVDPTAPPAAVLAGSKAPVDGEQAALPPAQRLQSILISPKRRVAVIDGKTVKEGAIHQGAVLASVRETYVILTKGGVRETLRLYPPPASKPAEQKTR